MSPAGFFYRRLASPLHATRPGVGALWILSLTATILLTPNPLPLAILLVAVLAAGAGARVSLLGVLRRSMVVWLPIVLVNVLVSRQGLTVFARVGDLGPFGQGNLTVEAAVYGAVVALKVVLLVLVTALGSLAVDPDGMLRIVRRLSFRSALTASLTTRMVPVLAADAQRLAEAQRTRPGRSPRRLALLRAVVAGSLDRSLDVAATLELRGFATAPRAPRYSRPWSRHDLAFLASALAILAVGVLAGPGEAASFQSYPVIHVTFGLGTVVLAAALVLAVLLPFCDRRGIDP